MLAAGNQHQFIRLMRQQRFAIGAVGGNRIIDIHNGNDPGKFMNVRSSQPSRIAGSVILLMMLQRDMNGWNGKLPSLRP